MSKLMHITIIVLSIMSIIFSILVYFGITRYIKLYMTKSIDKYAEGYSSLSFARENRTVIVFTVENQSDIDNLIPTLNSLLDQTVRVNQIFVVLSGLDMPDHLTKVLSVIEPGKIYDDQYHDIISLLHREKEKDILIIKVLTGVIYSYDFIQNVVEESEANPDSVIRDNSGLFITVKPSFIKLDDNSKFIDFTCSIKDISCHENYKY